MIDAAKVSREEEVFLSFEENRKGLQSILDSAIFKNAWKILDNKRKLNDQVVEASNLAADPLVSVRINSQRLAVDERLDDLWALTDPPLIPDREVPATFEPEEQ